MPDLDLNEAARTIHELHRTGLEAAQDARKRLSAVRSRLGGSRPAYVYFVRPVGGGLIKIGWAVDPVRRCKQLQTSSPAPLPIVGLRPGNV
jgi:hypothetical protein